MAPPANFPRMGVPGTLEMPLDDAIVAMSSAFDRPEARDAVSKARERERALLLAVTCDVAPEDPEMIIKMMPADGDTLTCVHCGAD